MFGQELFGMGIVLGFRNQAKTGMDMAKKDFDSLYYSASKADKETKLRLEAMSQNWRKAKMNFAMSGAAIAGIGIMSSLNMDTEQATADLRSLGTKGAEAYIDAARNLIAKEKLPIDYRRGLSELYNLKSGDLGEDVLISALKATGTTALATQGDISEAVSSFITDYNLSFDKMAGTTEQKAQRWSDVVSSTVQKYYTKLPTLSAQHEKVAADAALMGYGIEQTYTAIGALMSGGVKEEAGSSLRAAFSKLGHAAEVTGLQFTDANNRFIPFIEIIDKLREKYGPTLEANEIMELEKAFDREGKKAVATLMLKRDAYEEGIELAKRYGQSNKMAAEVTDTLKFKVVGLKNALLNLGDTIGGSDDSSRGFVENTTDLINKTDDVLKKHPGIVKGGFDYMKLVAGFGSIAGLGYGKDILKGGMIRAMGPSVGGTAFGWMTPLTGAFAAYQWTQHLRHLADAEGPTVESEGLNLKRKGIFSADFWKGNWGAEPAAPEGYVLHEPDKYYFGSDKNIPSGTEVDPYRNELIMRGGRFYRPTDKEKPPENTKKAAKPQEVTATNSFNVTLQFPNATSPEQIKAEIEKYMKQRNENIKRWFGLRRGEEPVEYEN